MHPPQQKHLLAKRKFFQSNSFWEAPEVKGKLLENICLIQIIKESKILYSLEQQSPSA